MRYYQSDSDEDDEDEDQESGEEEEKGATDKVSRKTTSKNDGEDEGDKNFEKGDRVEGRWKGSKEYHPGVVVKNNNDGTCHVKVLLLVYVVCFPLLVLLSIECLCTLMYSFCCAFGYARLRARLCIALRTYMYVYMYM